MKAKAFYSILVSLILMQLISLDASGSKAQNETPLTYVTGHLDNWELQDTIILDIIKEFSSSAMSFSTDRSIIQVAGNGYFKFILPALERPVYISLHTPEMKGVHYSDWRYHLLDIYLLMPGDSVHISYLDPERGIVFSGKSAPQFRWLYETRKQVTLKAGSLPKAALYNNPEQWLASRDTFLNLSLNNLAAIKNEIRPDVYTILKADAIGTCLGNVFMNLSITDLSAAYKDPVITARTLQAYYTKFYEQPADTASSELLASSRSYITYLLNKARTEFRYRRLMDLPHPEEFFTALKDSYPAAGPLKEKMIMAYLYERIAGSLLTDAMISDAMKIVRNPRYRDMLLGMQDTFGKGQPVETDHVFKDREEQPVRLSDYKGKVMFVDMWFTGCAGCIAVAKGLPRVEEEFSNNPDVVFVSLSMDKDKIKWLRSIDGNSKVFNAAGTTGYTHYTTSGTKYIYTGGLGFNHPFVKKYNPTGTFPHLLLIDKTGRTFTSNIPLPVNEEGQARLISLIEEALAAK